LCFSYSDGLQLDVVKVKETDRYGLLETFVGSGLACNCTLRTQTTHWQCAALCNMWGLKKIRCCIDTSSHLMACHAGSVVHGYTSQR
jgi:hypothetical protein